MVSYSEILQQKAIDYQIELETEFNLECAVIPEIKYVHKRTDFNELGLSNSYYDEYLYVVENKSAITLTDKNLILIALKEDYVLAEEIGHFLHFKLANIRKSPAQTENLTYFNIYVEMLGYFSSKIIDPTRENKVYGEYKDFTKLSKPELIKEYSLIKNNFGDRVTFNNFFLYQQGYCLGDELFYHYISKQIPKKQIKNLYELNVENMNFKNLFNLMKYNLPQILNKL
ncbi:hypothetical protein K9L67_04265 [Candidatus Woesearchaeota archaeon]|nr:hypothetical protein [Candidatus Woesearchaeota archaeon]MCF7901413.1 hypothetical protein [Candidatus Woesearchaeota archaeon]MCF8012974.1 hypothetical protein [Candidatus Woesearchaeota archaeon]